MKNSQEELLKTIKRITNSDDIFISQINSLLDKDKKWDIKQGKKFLENLDNALFLAFQGKEAVGFIIAHRLQRFDKRQAGILLYKVNVNENFRRQGIGKALVEAVKNWGRETGADEVWVLTNKANIPANALYKSTNGTAKNSDDIMYTFKL